MSYLSRTVTPANGVAAAFPVSFAFLSRSDVNVYVRSPSAIDPGMAKVLSTDYDWTSNGLITFRGGHIPASGQMVDIRRFTNRSVLRNTFASGGAIPANKLNENDLQELYISQELADDDQDQLERIAQFEAEIASLGGSVGGGGTAFSSRTIMKASDAVPGTIATLNEAGRRGIFYLSSSNYAAEVTADPTECIYVPRLNGDGSNGAWIRIHGGRVTPFMAGAIDCTGSPKLSDEAVTDCIAALDGMWSIVKFLGISRQQLVRMDLSECQGLGISRTWVLDSGLDGALWNSITWRVTGGRLVAMAYMGDMIHLKNKGWHFDGLMEVWGGTDTQLNTGDYTRRFAKNGLKVLNIGGARLGDWTFQGLRRFGVQYDKNPGALENNNIPVTWGKVIAIQCGCRTSDSVKFAGTYTLGSWLNQPADNGSDSQRQRIQLNPSLGCNPLDIELGDTLENNALGAVNGAEPAVVQNIVSTSPLVVDVWPWLSVEAAGTFQSMHGGGVSMIGGNTANTNFDLLEVFSAGCGIQLGSLYGPTIRTSLFESCLVAVQLGITGLESMEGIAFLQYHIENVDFSILDYASCSGAWFGIPSNLATGARGKFDYCRRIMPNAISTGTFVAAQKGTLRGVSFMLNGGIVSSPVVITKQIGAIAGCLLGNAPELHGIGGIFNANAWTFTMISDRSQADAISEGGKEAPFFIMGTGPGGAPTSSVYFQTNGSDPIPTLEGQAAGAGLLEIKPGIGAIKGFMLLCPQPGTDVPDWKLVYWRCNRDMGGLASPTGVGGTATQATSKATTVALSKANARITMNAAALAAGASVSFLWTNTLIKQYDAITVNIVGGASPDAYEAQVTQVDDGQARIQLHNFSAGPLGEAVVLLLSLDKRTIN